jgi:uncharacterized protein with GYD domain
MATYIATIKFNLQGVEDIGETTKGAVAFFAAAKKMGIKIRGSYWTTTTGYLDGVIVFEAADDETATAARFYLGGLGFVHITKIP